MTNLVFTYGTLLKGQSRNHVLKDCKYISDAILDDYGLYEVGTYPAAVPMNGFKVYGEIYEINDVIKKELDYIEGEGYLYKYKEVIVHDSNNKQYNVGFYEYLLDTNNLPLSKVNGKWNTSKMY